MRVDCRSSHWLEKQELMLCQRMLIQGPTAAEGYSPSELP